MRVLVYEPSFRGHNYRYTSLLCKTLLELPVETTLILTPEGRNSPHFQTHLQDIADKIVIVTDSENEMPGTLSPVQLGKKRALEISQLADQYSPDHLYALSSETAMPFMGLRPRLWKNLLPSRMQIETIFLTSRACRFFYRPTRFIRDLAWLTALGRSPCTRMHFAGYWIYRWARRWAPWLRNRIRLIPDPVDSVSLPSRTESRRLLGLPVEGRFVGVFGYLDRRKSIAELLRGFFYRPRAGNVKVVLGGELDPECDHIVEEYSDALRSGSLVLINGYLTKEQFYAGLGSLDVISLLYAGENWASSGLLLEAAMTRKPVLATSRGWIGYATKRFGLGRTVKSLSPRVLSEAISDTLNMAESSLPLSDLTRRWLFCSSSRMFCRALTQRLRERLSLSVLSLPDDCERVYCSE